MYGTPRPERRDSVVQWFGALQGLILRASPANMTMQQQQARVSQPSQWSSQELGTQRHASLSDCWVADISLRVGQVVKQFVPPYLCYTHITVAAVQGINTEY